ncbi:TDT family transporter [Arcanobacterium hippocoleae]|uniref:TDT family transporter n=1 Tax=Arcanobacterium hippocoleae TaxID=149017 RepID=UPI0033423468
MRKLNQPRNTRYTQVPLPPAGPSWYPAVMGTGILSTLLHLQGDILPGARLLALLPFTLSWLILIGLTSIFAIHILRDRRAFTQTIRNQNLIPMWGTVAMGILSVGSATLTILPYWFPALAVSAFWIDLLFWIIATFIGLVTAFGFGVVLSGRIISSPIAVWGLAVVGPMVSATVGAGIAGKIEDIAIRGLMLFLSTACFFIAFVLGTVIFARVYHYHWRISKIPVNASLTAWIPLGMVGQSTAAVQVIALNSEVVLHPDFAHMLHRLANFYGYCMFLISVPLIIWAIKMTVHGFRNNMVFTSGWWALTFPIGTLALGSFYLWQARQLAIFQIASLLYVFTLCCTVGFCLYASIRAIAAQAQPQLQPSA